MVPGEMAHFTSTVILSDGTTQDVTAEARWHCSDATDASVVSIHPPGAVQARNPGWVRVHAETKDGQTLTSDGVGVAPEGVFLLTVGVNDGQEPIDFWTPVGYIPDARVQVTSRASAFSALADAYGGVTLPAVGDTVLEVQKVGYESIKASVMTTNDHEVWYVLKSAGSPQRAARAR